MHPGLTEQIQVTQRPEETAVQFILQVTSPLVPSEAEPDVVAGPGGLQ